MSASVWPLGLPQKFLIDGFSEGLANNRIRSQNDIGPAKVRPRSTAGVRMMAGSMSMTTDQLAVFKDFVEVDIFQGASPFTFPNQTFDGDAPYLVRFAEEMPQWQWMAPHTWKVDMKLEILP